MQLHINDMTASQIASLLLGNGYDIPRIIKCLLTLDNIPVSTFCREIGMNRNYLHAADKGYQSISNDTKRKIIHFLKIDLWELQKTPIPKTARQVATNE